MKTNLIEITVRGKCGGGKSEALEVIKKALKEFYNRGDCRIGIAGINPDGAIESAKTTRQTALGEKTVFVLYEEVEPVHRDRS